MSARRPAFRWWIAGLLALATALSYLDRQSFPIVAGEIRKEIPMSDEDYGRLASLFLLAYGVMYAGGGKLLDVWGTRVGYTVMILWWSAADALTGAVSSLAGLAFCRFMLGMGEGGGFPASGKAVAEWFPPRERSLAFGIFNTGSSLGAIVAAPLLALIAHRLGWRWVFFATGAVGFLWAALWLRLYRPPAESPYLGADERRFLVAELPAAGAAAGPPIRWRSLFGYRQVWALMLAKVLTDSVWYFLLFWLPRYLGDQRGFDLEQIGAYAWIPYACAGAGSFCGGWLGTHLIRRGASLDRARKVALATGACCMPAALLVVPSPVGWALAFYGMALFGHQFWSANVQTLAADLFPSRVVGSVEGLLGSAGALGGALFGELTGRVIQARGYGLPFLCAGLLHLAAFALIVLVVRRIEPVGARVS